MPQTGITYRNNPLVQLVKASKYATDFELNVTHRITKSQFDMDRIQLVAVGVDCEQQMPSFLLILFLKL